MELIDIIYLVALILISFISIKAYSALELAKQERISEERENKARIYAEKDFKIAQTEASVFNTGFDNNDQGDDMSSIIGLLSNPEIMKTVSGFMGNTGNTEQTTTQEVKK